MVDIRFADPSEREEIAQFMDAAFPRAKWDMCGWRAILSGRWADPDDPFAISVRNQGRLVGCLGLVASHHVHDGARRRILNMTSWYLNKELRGTGTGKAMLHLLLQNPDDTITNFTSAPGAAHAVRAAGMQVLDAERLIWRPDATRTPLPMPNDLPTTDAEARVLADHKGLDLHPVQIETPDGPLLVILSIKQKHEDYVTHELFHASDLSLLARYIDRIAATLLPPDRAIFAVDRRFLPTETQADEVQAFAVPRFWSPGQLKPEQIDHLYSETVLLGLKLY